jgi:cytochrome c oxidase subunit IV
MTEQTTQVVPQPVDKAKIRKLIRVALILAGVTAFEFLIAFTMQSGWLKVSIFIALTLVKAFYIVAEFMHLKYEVKVLIYSIVIPMIFVLWLIVALIYEGGSIFQSGL